MDDNLSQIIVTHYKCTATSTTHQCATASIKKPIHNVKDLRPDAAQPLSSKSRQRKLDVFTSGCLGSALLCVPYRAPSDAAKLRLVARFAALAGLADVRFSFAKSSRLLRLGGAYRDRTDDLMLAKQPLSQLS